MLKAEEASDLLQNPDNLVWIDNCKFNYWIMDHSADGINSFYASLIGCQILSTGLAYSPFQVRPVITVAKTFNLKDTEIDWEECHDYGEE